MKKILIIFSFLITTICYSQTTTITSPIIKNYLKFQANNTTLVDSGAGLWFSRPGFFQDYIKINQAVLDDSTGWLVTNRPIKTNSLVKWIDSSYIKSNSITANEIKLGTITSGQLTTSLKDSLFSDISVAGINLKIDNLKTDYNVLFNDYGNFKPGVLQTALSYDSTNHQLSVVVDTSKGIRISGGKITSDMADVYDFATNKFISEVKIGDLAITDNSGTLNLADSIATQQVAANTFLINWQNTSELYELKIDANAQSDIDFRAGDPATGDLNFYTGPGPSLKLDGAGNMYINFSNIRTQNANNSLNMYNRWNIKDTMDFNGSVVLNFPTLDALNVSSSGTLYDAIIDNSLSLGIAFDGSAPATNLGGGAPGSYYGSSGANYLGDPAKWMIITLNGNLYRIPLYTP